MKNNFVTASKVALVLVYLVVLAGALVRMTGSGMGCPDWPKCFGYFIPPTDAKTLVFAQNHDYNKGQVIIKDEALLVAKNDFVSSTLFNDADWEKYTKHDYAIFNPWHTWIEYINRLFGALAGLACLYAFGLSFSFWNKNKRLVFYAFAICFLMGFQAWLGKTVVDSVLSPIKITTHMLVALFIIGLQLYTIRMGQQDELQVTLSKKTVWLVVLTIVLTIIQVVLGTTVREHVDVLVKADLPAVTWLQSPTVSFYIHRSLSIFVFISNGYLYRELKRQGYFTKTMLWILSIIGLEIFTGIMMYYFEFPFGTQPLHLVLASLLFGFQFKLMLNVMRAKKI
jgi:heme a synthase